MNAQEAFYISSHTVTGIEYLVKRIKTRAQLGHYCLEVGLGHDKFKPKDLDDLVLYGYDVMHIHKGLGIYLISWNLEQDGQKEKAK